MKRLKQKSRYLTPLLWSIPATFLTLSIYFEVATSFPVSSSPTLSIVSIKFSTHTSTIRLHLISAAPSLEPSPFQFRSKTSFPSFTKLSLFPSPTNSVFSSGPFCVPPPSSRDQDLDQHQWRFIRVLRQNVKEF